MNGAAGGGTADEIRPFPWRELMALCLGRYGWRPRDFWAATPREIACLLGEPERQPAIGRGELEALIARFPDGAN
ncbi:phage tail assembly chaperone [Stappia albiluteola]|nr:phage tail assembly chaperone [Stappia albiluteola]